MPHKVNYGIDYDDAYDEYKDDDYDYDYDYDFDKEDQGDTPESSRLTKNPGIWCCSICTYDNDQSLSACEICGVLRNPLVNNGSQRRVAGLSKNSGVSIMAKSLFASSSLVIPKTAVLVPEQNDESETKKTNNLIKSGDVYEVLHKFHKRFNFYNCSYMNIAPFKFDVPSPDDVVSYGLHSSKSNLKASHTYLKSAEAFSDTYGITSSIKAIYTAERSDSTESTMPNSRVDGYRKEAAINAQSSFEISDGLSTSRKKSIIAQAEKSKFSENLSIDARSDKRSESSFSLLSNKTDENVDISSNSAINQHKLKGLTTSLNNVGLDVRSPYSNVTAKGADMHAQYEREKWMLPDEAVGSLTQLNLAIVGHVDSGKSTLSGRLLHLSGQISQKEMHHYEKEAKLQGKGSFAFAWALDESAEERERGITMTVGVAYFDSKRYHIVVLDSPGHKDFVPNMISGATQADAAILAIDASVGAFEAGMDGAKGQTKEHAQLIRSFGVDQIIVAVNKMDVVEYSKDRYDSIQLQMGTFLRTCGFKDSSMSWIPLSAMGNQNLVTAPSDIRLSSWYRGPNLLEAIDLFQPPTRDYSKPLLMPICDIIKTLPTGQVSVCGKLEAGAFRVGSKVLVMPSGAIGTLRSLERDSHACTVARAGDNVTVGLQDIDERDVRTGGVLCHPDFPVAFAKQLELKVLVLDFATPILIGSQLECHVHCTKEAARVVKIASILDPRTGKTMKKAPRILIPKQTAIIEVVLHGPVCVEAFSTSKALGRIFLRALGRTVAVGVITRIIQAPE